MSISSVNKHCLLSLPYDYVHIIESKHMLRSNMHFINGCNCIETFGNKQRAFMVKSCIVIIFITHLMYLRSKEMSNWFFTLFSWHNHSWSIICKKNNLPYWCLFGSLHDQVIHSNIWIWWLELVSRWILDNYADKKE